jgi:GT2 family glycosyltransferase
MTAPTSGHARSESPSISVVIPTHQRASLLERSLKSLTSQTLPSSQFEVVVVDDGSTDETEALCERFADELPLLYFRIENSGIAAAKNLGLFAAQAPLVLFFDDDDLADACLLEAHLEAHREHPEENIAVLGYTTWAPELEVTPLMTYVTEVNQLLFSYPNIEDGEMLDYTYFWGGRSSCKRSFLAQHGSFDQDIPSIEDIELGFRLAKHGLSVVHSRSAKSHMVRPVSYDEFARRCRNRGRSLWLFNSRHSDPEVQAYCRVAEALEKWPSMAASLDEKIDRIRELEQRHSEEGGLGESDLSELYELYGWTFEALQARGISEAAAEDQEPDNGISSALSREPALLSPTCPDPVFVIGSPRSGTTVLATALAEHDQLWTSGESYFLFHLLRDGHAEGAFERSMEVPGPRWLRVEEVSRQELLAYLGMGLNALYTSRSGGRRWIDHTPLYTLVADTLAEAFPGASFIHILRDGREVVNSMLKFAGSVEGDNARFIERTVPWANDVREACDAWRQHVEVATNFCEAHPDRAMVVRYEELVAEPRTTFREIHGFLGVPDDPAPARYLTLRRINSSYGTGPRPSVDELWEGWDEDRRQVFTEVAGRAMHRCGYRLPDRVGSVAEAETADARSGGQDSPVEGQ